jgi:hypothetical protein
MVTEHAPALGVDEQPDQDVNELTPDVAGAVSVTVAPAVKTRVKVVAPLAAPLASAGDTPIDMPEAGFTERTVRV